MVLVVEWSLDTVLDIYHLWGKGSNSINRYDHCCGRAHTYDYLDPNAENHAPKTLVESYLVSVVHYIIMEPRPAAG